MHAVVVAIQIIETVAVICSNELKTFGESHYRSKPCALVLNWHVPHAVTLKTIHFDHAVYLRISGDSVSLEVVSLNSSNIQMDFMLQIMKQRLMSPVLL
jgi:hypothetical protein